jgi:aminoglycoside phosphotransferase (APT) family kinase protein
MTMAMTQVVSGRAGPTDVRAVLLHASTRSSVRRALGTLLPPGARLGTCRLRRVKFKPGRKLTACYDVSAEGSGARVRPVTVTWLDTGAGPVAHERAPASLSMEEEAGRRGLVAPFSRLATCVARLGMTVQIAPLDPLFPQLVRLTDPIYVARMLERSGGRQAVRTKAGPEITAVRYRPGQRHVLRYRSAGDEPRLTVFAKLHRPGDPVRSYRTAFAVADVLEVADGALTGARPAAHVAADDVVLYSQVEGTPLSSLLRRNPRRGAKHLRQAGMVLRRLHDAPDDLARGLPAWDAAAEIAATERAGEHVAYLLSRAATIGADVVGRAGELLAQVPTEPPVFGHGDYKADHLYVGARGLTLIDFDSCRRAEPALDLGKFLADLRWWFSLTGQPGLGAAQERFLEGYGPTPRPRVVRARVYEAILLLKLTARRVPLNDADWVGRTATLLARADDLLRDLTRR